MEQQITGTVLPLASDAIVANLEKDLLRPVLASGLMARNNFLEAQLLPGKANSQELIEYLASIQQKTGAITTFLVSDADGRYYHPRGILKTISPRDPQDAWYYRFRASGEPIEINIDRDTADLRRTTAFINAPVLGQDGRFLGATGLGLDFQALQALLRRTQARYGARILLVNRAGKVMLASDNSRGTLAQQPGLAEASRRLLSGATPTLRLNEAGGDRFVRANRIPEIGWTVVVIQQRTAEQGAFLTLLAQNLINAVLLSLVLLCLAQLTLGREQQRLERMARTDELSGLLNRAVFDAHFRRLVAQTQQRGEWLAVALMDIDHFKTINDTYGHPVGDAVIRHVSQRILSRVRTADPPFRWGGEEFLLLLPGCSLLQARERLEAIRRDLHTHPFQLTKALHDPPAGEGRPLALPVTLSFGLTLHRPMESSAALLQRVDRALYAAKREGRDCIVTLDEPLPTPVDRLTG